MIAFPVCKLYTELINSCVTLSPSQAVLFTETIVHKRGEFFFDSRIVFESVFVVDFDPESVLQQQTLYSIQDVAKELEFIATNVCLHSSLICTTNNPLLPRLPVLQTAGGSNRRV